jgi:hypothetical protein
MAMTSMTGAVRVAADGPGSPIQILPHLVATRSLDGAVTMPGAGTANAAGLALKVDPNTDGFLVEVVDRDGTMLVRLGPFDQDDIVAVWRALGASSGLPLMVERPDGGLDAPYAQVGPLPLGAVRIRRRHGLLNGRRPRFLVRRRTGRLPPRPRVFRGDELFSQNR